MNKSTNSAVIFIGGCGKNADDQFKPYLLNFKINDSKDE